MWYFNYPSGLLAKTNQSSNGLPQLYEFTAQSTAMDVRVHIGPVRLGALEPIDYGGSHSIAKLKGVSRHTSVVKVALFPGTLRTL